MARVEVTTAGHSVIVEAGDVDLDAVAAKALELWRATHTDQSNRGPATAGFTSERSGAQGNYTSGPDLR